MEEIRIVTISREFGSGGRTIGKTLARRLGVAYYDKELVKQVSLETGFDPGFVEERGEFAGNGFEKNDLKHTLGVLSMARAMHPDSAGSQFFIMVDAAPHLDGQYAAFGRITENVEAAVAVSRVPRNMMNDKPNQPQTIKSIRVDTLGEDYPEPEKK